MKKLLFKIFFSLIVVTYMFSTVGLRLVAHYCGGSLEKVALFSKPSSCCSGEEQESDTDDCCKNDSRHVVFQKDFTFHTIVSDCKVPVQQLFLIERNHLYDISFASQAYDNFQLSKKIPPPNLVQDAIVSSSVLRI